MDNSIWFFRGRSAFSIPWVFSSNMLNAVDGKHFGFNMLSSSVANALLILIFSHDHAVVAMPCGDGATYMVCHSLRKHRSEFAQNNWFLCCVLLFWILSAPITFEMVLYFISKALSPSFKPFWFQVSLPLWYLSWLRVYYNIHEFTKL